MVDFANLCKVAHDNPEQLGKIAILFGGETTEKQVSKQSAKSCLDALLSASVDVVAVEINDWRKDYTKLGQQQYNCVLNLIHGVGGEDGSVQGLLNLLKISYVGSDLLACAIAMDKMRCKQIWQSELQVPKAIELNLEQPIQEQIATAGLDFPVIIKPNREGSSNGVSRVDKACDLDQAVHKSNKFSNAIIVEQYISGREVTVSVINEQAFEPIEIIPQEGTIRL